MVEKLFRTGPYLDSCDATITESTEEGIKLDRTVFFAFSGGQQSDSGTIGGHPVLEARAQGSEIIYKLDNASELKVGDMVEVKIDIEKRKRIMRLHSAAHLVYFVFSKHTGLKKLIGSNVTEEKSRLDFESENSISELLPKIEEESNALIANNLPIKTRPDENNPDKWWWECGDMKCPCGGTHVNSSSEIGKIKLKRKNIGSGKERLEIRLA